MQAVVKYSLFLILLITGPSFQKKEKVDLVALELKRKVSEYRIEQMNICRKNIIKDAEIYVDSIIALQMDETFVDTIKSPPKPLRPERPFDTLKLDSLDLSPLIKGPSDNLYPTPID